MSVTVLFLTAVAPVSAVDTSKMDVIYSDPLSNGSKWLNPQGNWNIGSSPNGWGTGNVAYIGSEHVAFKNRPQNLITNPDKPIDLTGYNTVLLQFDTNAVSTKRGNQKENVIVTDEHGVQHVVWAKSKATFSGIQQVDISNYVAGNKSIIVTFQYVKKGPAKGSLWEVDDFEILGCTTAVKPYSTIQFNQSIYTVTEGDGVYAVLNLTRTPDYMGTVKVNWTAIDGTALAGVNYGIPGDYNDFDVNGTVIFNDGDTYNNTIRIPIWDDSHYSVPDLSFNVTIEDVTDESGNTITGTPGVAEVIINDADSSLAVKVTMPEAAEINEGSTWTSSGSFSDLTVDAIWTATVNYGDGDGDELLALADNKTFTLSHTYDDDNIYTVTVTVANGKGSSGSDYTTVTVDDVAPTVDSGADATIDEGSTFSNSGSFTDPGADMWTATVDYGDGSGVQDLTLTGKTFQLSHVYADEGEYTVTVTMTDDDGGEGSDTVKVTVSNVAPTLTLSGASSVDEGATYTLLLDSNDPGADTIASWSINWGDSNVEPVSGNPTSATHVYAAGPNDYEISATATDEDGTWNAGNTVPVHVNVVSVTCTISLKPGWNLISVPLNMPDNSIEGFFPAEAREDLVAIWGWNDDGQSWKYYSPDPYPWYAENFPAVTNMETGKAYWVQMNDGASFTITGTIPSSAPASPQQFVSNWNFMGPTGTTSSTPGTMYPDAIAVWGWNAETQGWMYYSSDPYPWYAENFPVIANIDPGHGYWVQMPELGV